MHPATPADRRRRNAERLAAARAALDRLEREAAVTGRAVDLRLTDAGFAIALAAGRPGPKSFASLRRG